MINEIFDEDRTELYYRSGTMLKRVRREFALTYAL